MYLSLTKASGNRLPDFFVFFYFLEAVTCLENNWRLASFDSTAETKATDKGVGAAKVKVAVLLYSFRLSSDKGNCRRSTDKSGGSDYEKNC